MYVCTYIYVALHEPVVNYIGTLALRDSNGMRICQSIDRRVQDWSWWRMKLCRWYWRDVTVTRGNINFYTIRRMHLGSVRLIKGLLNSVIKIETNKCKFLLHFYAATNCIEAMYRIASLSLCFNSWYGAYYTLQMCNNY